MDSAGKMRYNEVVVLQNPVAREVAVIKRVGLIHHPKLPATQPMAETMARELGEYGVTTWIGSTWDVEAVTSEIANLDLLVTQYHRGETCRGQYVALNDVVVSRGSLARMVRLETRIDGSELTTYAADGLIVSTPTGSTAYALAVGGPILPPQLKNILLLPIAAHLSMDRAIVLAQGAIVKIQVQTDHQAILTVDGQFEYELLDGDWVTVQASRHTSRFARLQDQTYFYRTLMERLRWSLPG
jgi:NAD kinase